MKTPLRIGYFVKMYPRLSETFILNEILEMERRGVEVTVFSLMKPDEGRFHPQVTQIQAPVFYLDDPRLKTGWRVLHKNWPTLSGRRDELWALFEELIVSGDKSAIDLFFSAAAASALALEAGLDHLHAHFASMPSTAAYYASRITGLGFSFTAHAKDIFTTAVDTELLERKIDASRFVATVTHFNKRHLLSLFPALPADKIKVVYNGIDLDLFGYGPESRRRPGLILAVGRLVPKKGFRDLLAACSILKARGVPFDCLVVGDGEERDALASISREHGLTDHVSFVGPKTQAEVREYLDQASVFVLPCTMAPDGNQDALPTVLLEALATGCPVVSTTISGVPEIVESGEDGILVSPEDPMEIANAIERILTDRELATGFALRGRRKAEERFDVMKSAAVLEGCFRQAADAGMAGPVGGYAPVEESLRT